MDATAVYRLLDDRLPFHVGTSGTDLPAHPVTSVRDPAWLTHQVELTRRLYGMDTTLASGMVWWYSASSMLLAPTIESLLMTGTALDPLSVVFHQRQDGRFAGARASAVCPSVGDALAEVISMVVEAVAAVSGAHQRALWAIAGDSLANRVLWAGGTGDEAVSLASSVAGLPAPRFVDVCGTAVVRRGSCCLIFQSTSSGKCVSCPRQTPDERMARLRERFC